jgi:hypothetical protein
MPVVGTTRRFALLEKDVEVQLDLAQMLLEQAEQIQKQLDHEKDHCEHNAGNVSSRVAIGRAIPEPTANEIPDGATQGLHTRLAASHRCSTIAGETTSGI